MFDRVDTNVSILQARRLRKADPVKNGALYSEHDKTDWSFWGIIHRTLYRPFHMLSKEPILALTTLYLSFIYGILYARECHLTLFVYVGD
jgi:MFS transporter, DHA1 family, multidrug resistance protein